jgi:hypothetical protein
LRLAALFAPDSFRVVAQGRPVRPAAYRDRSGWVRWEAITQLRAAGASLNLTRVEDYSSLLLAFTRVLERELDCPVQINVYTTPGESQGLGAHTDPHDVLVLQLRGKKTWNVAGIGGGISSDELTLEPGDWLFVPRGTRHEVRNLGREATTHLAIGLHPLTWADFWQKALDRARKQVPGLAGAVTAAATPELAAAGLATDLLPILSAADPALARAQHHDAFRNFAVAVPPQDIIESSTLEQIDERTRFCWRPEATVRAANEFFEVDLPYRRAPLPLRPDLEAAVRFMITTAPFCSSDVSSVEAPTALLLCRLLAGVGVLRVLP